MFEHPNQYIWTILNTLPKMFEHPISKSDFFPQDSHTLLPFLFFPPTLPPFLSSIPLFPLDLFSSLSLSLWTIDSLISQHTHIDFITLILCGHPQILLNILELFYSGTSLEYENSLITPVL